VVVLGRGVRDACHRAALLRPLRLGLAARRVVAPALDPPATGRGERRAARQLGWVAGRGTHRTARAAAPAARKQ